MNTLSIAYQPSWNSGLGGNAAPTRGLSGNAAAHGRAPGLDMSGLSATFADDVAQRLLRQGVTGPDGREKAGERDAGSLTQALSEAMDFMRSNYGDAAATTAMAMVYRNLGEDEITEDDLGRGLLAAVAVVDRSFGFAEGDKVMAHFNGALNEAVNEFFDNGLQERFWASGPASGNLGLSISKTLADMGADLDEDTAAALSMLLDSALEASDPEALRRALPGLAEELEKTLGPGAGSALAEGVAGNLAGPAPQAWDALPGRLLDMSV